MGLATARALARAGRRRGGLRAVRGRARQRLESRRLAHHSPLLSRGTLGAAGTGGVSALAGARGRLGPGAARPARDARPRRLAGEPRRARRVRRAVRGAGRGRDRATLPDPSWSTARAGSSRPTAGSSTPTSRCRRCSARRPRRARTCASERGSRRSRTRARRSCSTDLRAKAVVVTAGAWAPGLVGVDATPTRETASYFAFDEPVPSVIDNEPR